MPPKHHIPSNEELAELVKANKSVYSEYFNPDFVRSLNDNVLEEVINPTYFRPVFIGFDEPIERNESNRPAILASNHSGMAFPWDAIVFGCGMYKKFNYEQPKLFRPLAAPILSKTALMNPFLIQDCWKMCGGIDATYLNFETLMEYTEGNILIYPEGVPGIGKGFNRKYKLQRFATSFVRMAIKYKTDIIPFATVNAEYVNPYSYSVNWINRLTRKIGIPFLPLTPLLLFMLIQPWLFYLSFPAKMTYVRGRRIKPYEMTKGKAYEELSDAELHQIRDEIHDLAQEGMDAAVEAYGDKPIRWREMFKAAWTNRHYFPYYFPFMWPFLFTEFERQWYAQPVDKRDGSGINMKIGWFTWLVWLVRNPIIIAYYIPILGWIPLAIKGYRKNKL